MERQIPGKADQNHTEVGVKESFKKNWWGVGLNGPDVWREWEMKNWQRILFRCPESGGEKEARKTENAMGGLC